MMSLLFRTLPAAVLALTVGAANAAYMDCSAQLSGLVSNTTACQVSQGVTQDFPSSDPLTVNENGGFFGIDTWQYIDKDELAASAGQTGSWNLASDIWSQFDEILLVFKGGHESLVGYLVGEPATSGSWESPFRADVSHISYYGSGFADISEPATLLLMSVGLLAIGAVRMKRCG